MIADEVLKPIGTKLGPVKGRDLVTAVDDAITEEYEKLIPKLDVPDGEVIKAALDDIVEKVKGPILIWISAHLAISKQPFNPTFTILWIRQAIWTGRDLKMRRVASGLCPASCVQALTP